ncbi:MAG: DUF4743 domain-containing protein [Alphaproteobacteria bacterium]|nr:DUF4743 domain-containing protein [Alphaproteobacteria bacterium]
MGYLDKIARCNEHALDGFRPLVIDGAAMGWLAPAKAEHLAKTHGDVFAASNDRMAFAPHLDTPAARSRAVANIAAPLVTAGFGPKLHGELYAAKTSWSAPEAFRIDRSLVPGFGVRAYGVHINGYVRTSKGLSLWVGHRALDRTVEPGKVDNMVAGGQPAGLSLIDNVIKECGEEAGLTPALAAAAKPVGAIRYAFNTRYGFRNDTMFCFDLEVPADVTPVSVDGEMSSFTLMPVEEMLALVRDTDRVKFNVNLVMIDFAFRHGVLTPDTEPEYEAIVTRLRTDPGKNLPGIPRA